MRYLKKEYVLFDLEALHGTEQDDFMEIVEIAAWKIRLVTNKEGEVEIVNCGSYQSYVKPVYHTKISKKLNRILSLDMETLKKAPVYYEAIKTFMDWVGPDAVLVSWSKSDKAMLKENNRRHYVFDMPVFDYIDLQKEYDKLADNKKRTGLSRALGEIGVSFEGTEHCALYDAYNMIPLFKYIVNSTNSVKYKNSQIISC